MQDGGGVEQGKVEKEGGVKAAFIVPRATPGLPEAGGEDNELCMLSRSLAGAVQVATSLVVC